MPPSALDTFIARWSASAAAERANKDLFLTELCDVLGVERPQPATGEIERDQYVFEKGALILKDGQRTTTGHVDLYKAECFVLEAKQGSHDGGTKTGTARRGTGAWSNAMQEAFGQALQYARTLDDPPPFVIVTDIGYCFDLYATFDGSLDYRPFPDPRRSRLFLADLTQHVETLRAIFQDPEGLDPAKHAAKVTREIAGHLAELARGLEAEGHDPEKSARFLMRCLFTMFAEDAKLLPERVFTNELEKRWIKDPAKFVTGCESLWRAMESGNDFGYLGKLLRFNGGLFEDPTALPLSKADLERLLEAARASWVDVEPAIFGTLLERALDPRERHRLGAHYTPRAYVERLVKPTIEDPVRAEWDNVRTQVHQLVAQGKEAEAREAVKDFLKHLCSIRVLDPACGTGNFLYVTLDLFKRLEGEVVKLLSDLGETQQSLTMAGGFTVTPAQFLGIEVKPWAREIANLVLWIGYLQWQLRARGDASHFPEPVLQEYGNIECRDAVLAWDRIEPALDENGQPVTRWDGVTTKTSPVTGEQLPDERATIPVVRYINPRKSEWPTADFVVGNPPYVGTRRLKATLGEEYVDALRSSYRDVPETADLVMYWWHKAAGLAESGHLRAFGLLTTNSIVQDYSRGVLEAHLGQSGNLELKFAIPDHPWVESVDGAAVRVAMTVGSKRGADTRAPLLGRVNREDGDTDNVGVEYRPVAWIDAFLRSGSELSARRELRSNGGICFQGVVPAGDGFKLQSTDLPALELNRANLPVVVRPYLIGRDLVQEREDRFILDFFGRTEDSVRDEWPALYQRLLERVKPERDLNKRKSYREKWWIFAEPRPALRQAVSALSRYIGTPYTAKFRPFIFIPSTFLPDAMVYAIALDDGFSLGVLSSRAHCLWAADAGGTLEDRGRYNSVQTFLPFPFPASTAAQWGRIRELGEALDAHRKDRRAQHADVTITGMYNVMEKLQSGGVLTAKEKTINEHGLVSVLKQLHDNLDAAVFDAYGWPHDLTDEQILERLVALNAERAEEERNGLVRWLRPEFQNPQGEQKGQRVLVEAGGKKAIKGKATKTTPSTWPKDLPSRIGAIRATIEAGRGGLTIDDVATAFKGARRADIESILESLSRLGLARSYRDGNSTVWSAVRIA